MRKNTIENLILKNSVPAFQGIQITIYKMIFVHHVIIHVQIVLESQNMNV
jgi:hypothetical protein